MSKQYFKVFGLDCIEEANLIRRSLSGLINEKDLAFDYLQGKLVINLDNTPNGTALIPEIQLRLKNTGLHCILWDTYIQQAKNKASQLQKQKRRLTLGSGFFLFLGFFYHGKLHGWMEALTGDHSFIFQYPLIAILYGAAIVLGGWFIFPKALSAIRHRRPDMNLLMTIAVFGAILIGQWFEAASVTFLFSLALLIESWSIESAKNAIQELMKLTPPTAKMYDTNGKIVEKPIETIPINSIILVNPGEKIPLDGVVTSGTPSINQSSITGESVPVHKKINDEVYAGTLNGSHSFEFKTTQLANDTMLAHIIHLIEEAQYQRSSKEQWVTQFARYYTPATILTAFITAAVSWLFFDHSLADSFYQALVLLVIACPCALVISTPISIVAGLSRAARNGILIKGGNFLEIPAQLKAIAFDKTGTLTTGKASIQQIIPLNGHTEQELLTIAYALEIYSTHPLAQAVIEKAKEEKLASSPAQNLTLLPGKGVEGYINEENYWLGSHRLLHEKMPEQETEEFHQKALNLENKGFSVITIGKKNHICGLISVSDSLRKDAPTVLRQLKQLGIQHIAMLTGDNQATAESIAHSCELDSVEAELLPQDKLKIVQKLSQQYSCTAMVGDGVNDAPALAAAHLGIAMGTAGSDTAIETSDITLMSDDLSKIPWLIQHSRRVLKTIQVNIAFSLLIKMIFIMLAFFGKAALWMAITADMGASLLVIFNSLRLLKDSH